MNNLLAEIVVYSPFVLTYSAFLPGLSSLVDRKVAQLRLPVQKGDEMKCMFVLLNYLARIHYLIVFSALYSNLAIIIAASSVPGHLEGEAVALLSASLLAYNVLLGGAYWRFRIDARRMHAGSLWHRYLGMRGRTYLLLFSLIVNSFPMIATLVARSVLL